MDKFTLYLIGFFFVLGGIDYILGNRFKLGEPFEEGIKMMGVFGVFILGIYSLAPVIAHFLSGKIIPICMALHFDPSIVPATFISMDMGGYQLAMDLALDKEIGMVSGACIAASLGATISFSIPVAAGMIPKKDESYFFKGATVGIISLPIGFFLAGLCQKIDVSLLIWNLTPILIFTIILGIGLLKAPNVLIHCFSVLGKFIVSLSVIGLILQGVDFIFGMQLVSGLVPLSETMFVIGKSSFILAGAYPLLAFVNRIFKTHFEKIGEKVGMNYASVSGLVGNLANNMLIFGTYSNMNPKGKLICASFAIGGSFIFGGQLGFILGVAPNLLNLFIVSKLTSGITSIILSAWLYEYEAKKCRIKNVYETVNSKCVEDAMDEYTKNKYKYEV